MRLRRLSFRILLSASAALFGMVAGEGEAAAARTHSLRVQHGVLTVDGLTAKTGVDLRVPDLHYLFIYVPGVGTTTIAEAPFAGAREQKAAFHGNTLTVMAGDRRLQLTASNRLRSTHSAFVRLDRGAGPALREPAVGYGSGAWLSAVWPAEEAPSRPAHLRMRVKAHRALRTGKLCRPSPHGREVCATVREVVFQPN